jgi:redox-sensing transcriptional repressor
VTRKVSDSTIRRLSLYLRILELMDRGGGGTVSSDDLASAAGTTAAQVRKDLSLFGSFGKRGLGYQVADLAHRVRDILGLDRVWRVGLVGAGRIGSALFEYEAFRRRGFEVVSVLDNDPAKIGSRWGGVAVRDTAELEQALKDEAVEVVILTVPASAAQDIADRVVAAGIRGILNFAPAQLHVPGGVFVQDVNMVMELEALSFDLTNRSQTGDGAPPD